MRVIAYLFYGLAAVALVVGVWASISLGNEYGWGWGSSTEAVPLFAVIVGVPLWIGTLLHRRARRGNWID